MRVECEAEAQICERMKGQVHDLQQRESERGALLDNDKSEVEKLKLEFHQYLVDCNASVRAALLIAQRLVASSAGDASVHENQAEEREAELMATKADLEQLEQRVDTAEALSGVAKNEIAKLRQNLVDTAAEYEKLDLFSKDLQTRFNDIKEWYETFEAWNLDGKCLQCGHKLDVAALVEEKLKDERNDIVGCVDSTSESHA